MDTFAGFTDDIPFVTKTEQELQTLLFQFCETRKILIQLVSALRNNVVGEEISNKMVLKQVYNKLNEDNVRSEIFHVLCVNFLCVPKLLLNVGAA